MAETFQSEAHVLEQTPHEHGYTPAQLQTWCDRALLPPEAQTDPILMAWSDVRRRCQVEDRHVQGLISGIARDTVQKTYATLPELLKYCYRVAPCAGLLTILIIGLARGATMREAAPYAVKLGQALQLTDILADVGEDLETGRVYLPADETAENGLTAEDILARRTGHDRARVRLRPPALSSGLAGVCDVVGHVECGRGDGNAGVPVPS